MKRLILAGALAVGSLMSSGCGFVFVARGASYPAARVAPAHCSDCYHVPMGRAAYARCGHYDIRVVRDGYYYRPRHHRGHAEYRFVKFAQAGKHAHGDKGNERHSRR